MKKIRFTRTRLKAMIIVNLFLGIITIYSIHQSLETVATTAIAGILTITTMYIGGESYNRSSQNDNNNDNIIEN